MFVGLKYSSLSLKGQINSSTLLENYLICDLGAIHILSDTFVVVGNVEADRGVDDVGESVIRAGWLLVDSALGLVSGLST